MRRRFVESRGFSEDRRRLERVREFSHDDMVALEQGILADPEVGDLVPGTGGLRKVRAAQSEVRRGKRGGVRVYYWISRGAASHTWWRPSGSARSRTSRGQSDRQSPRSCAS